MADQSNGIAERFGLQSGIARETDGKPQLQTDEELAGTFTNTTLLLGDNNEGAGTLYLSTRYGARPSHSHRVGLSPLAAKSEARQSSVIVSTAYDLKFLSSPSSPRSCA